MSLKQEPATGLSVLELTDPACPWSWGSEPKVRWLRTALDDQATWRRVFGVLFDDEQPGPVSDPVAKVAWYQRFVDDVCRHTGAPAARRLQWVCLTSWPASLAATAALRQSEPVAERVLRRLREQTFVAGRPPDTMSAALAALTGLPGLELDRLSTDIASPEVRRQVEADHALTRELDSEIRSLIEQGPRRGPATELSNDQPYVMPTLVFEGPAGRVVVPGWRPLAEYVAAIGQVAPAVELRVPSAQSEAVLTRWRSLTSREMRLLTDENGPPPGALELVLRHGSLWIHPVEVGLDRIYQELAR